MEEIQSYLTGRTFPWNIPNSFKIILTLQIRGSGYDGLLKKKKKKRIIVIKNNRI